MPQPRGPIGGGSLPPMVSHPPMRGPGAAPLLRGAVGPMSPIRGAAPRPQSRPDVRGGAGAAPPAAGEAANLARAATLKNTTKAAASAATRNLDTRARGYSRAKRDYS